ncbi:MAG: hypothetical protein AAGA01_07500 [Cyanobacteria bacterium P01_E01_bin.43]
MTLRLYLSRFQIHIQLELVIAGLSDAELPRAVNPGVGTAVTAELLAL